MRKRVDQVDPSSLRHCISRWPYLWYLEREGKGGDTIQRKTEIMRVYSCEDKMVGPQKQRPLVTSWCPLLSWDPFYWVSNLKETVTSFYDMTSCCSEIVCSYYNPNGKYSEKSHWLEVEFIVHSTLQAYLSTNETNKQCVCLEVMDLSLNLGENQRKCVSQGS